MTKGVVLATIALPLLSLIAAAQTPPAAAVHTGKAVALMQDRQFNEAAGEFGLALAATPDNDDLRIQYATCLFAAERNEDARRQFELLRGRVGETPGISYYLGLLDLRGDNFAAAIRRLQPLESLPAFTKASYYLGMAYLGAGKTDAALSSLQRAAKSNPQDPDVHYRLARVLTATGRDGDAESEYQRYRMARETQRMVEEQTPLCRTALRNRPIAEARVICGRLAEPGDPRLLTLLGQLFAEAGAYTDALEPLRKAANLSPQEFDPHFYLGVSLFGLRNYAEARSPLEKAAQLNPQYFEALNLLAKTLYLLGDFRAALPVLEQAHHLNPSDTDLAGVLERLRLRPVPGQTR